jgi:hypothetical protein
MSINFRVNFYSTVAKKSITTCQQGHNNNKYTTNIGFLCFNVTVYDNISRYRCVCVWGGNYIAFFIICQCLLWIIIRKGKRVRGGEWNRGRVIFSKFKKQNAISPPFISSGAKPL